MRHHLVPALLVLAASVSALDVGIRAFYDIPPKDATATYDISGGGFDPSSSEWDTSGSASRMAFGLNAIVGWPDMGIATGGSFVGGSTALVATLGFEQVKRHADEGPMTSASSTKLRGIYLEPGLIIALGPHVGIELCARLATGRGDYSEDGLGDADADYRTYGAVLRPIGRAYGVELFVEAAWTATSITADPMTPALGAGEDIVVSQSIKGISYGAGVGLRF